MAQAYLTQIQQTRPEAEAMSPSFSHIETSPRVYVPVTPNSLRGAFSPCFPYLEQHAPGPATVVMSNPVDGRLDVRAALQIPLLRTKRHHRKSRSGCVTCKQRRIKVRRTHFRVVLSLIEPISATKKVPNVEPAVARACSAFMTQEPRTCPVRTLLASFHPPGMHKSCPITRMMTTPLEIDH